MFMGLAVEVLSFPGDADPPGPMEIQHAPSTVLYLPMLSFVIELNRGGTSDFQPANGIERDDFRIETCGRAVR